MKTVSNELKLVCIDLADMFGLNWMKYNNLEWRNQMSGMLMSTFLETYPSTVKKAGIYVVQNNKDEYPPSMGKIIQSMRDYIGTGKARTPKIESCLKCSDGFIKIAFWFRQNKNEVYRELNSACSECERGEQRKKKLNLLDNIETLVRLKNGDIYSYEKENGEKESLVIYETATIRKRVLGEWQIQKINRGIWQQSRKDEIPPIEITARDISNSTYITETESLKEEREKKHSHLIAIREQEKYLLERRKLELLNLYDNLNEAEDMFQTHKITKEIKILTKEIENTEHGLLVEYITLEEYLKAQQIKRGIVKY